MTEGDVGGDVPEKELLAARGELAAAAALVRRKHPSCACKELRGGRVDGELERRRRLEDRGVDHAASVRRWRSWSVHVGGPG